MIGKERASFGVVMNKENSGFYGVQVLYVQCQREKQTQKGLCASMLKKLNNFIINSKFAKLKFLFLKTLYEWTSPLVSFSDEGLLDFMDCLDIS